MKAVKSTLGVLIRPGSNLKLPNKEGQRLTERGGKYEHNLLHDLEFEK